MDPDSSRPTTPFWREPSQPSPEPDAQRPAPRWRVVAESTPPAPAPAAPGGQAPSRPAPGLADAETQRTPAVPAADLAEAETQHPPALPGARAGAPSRPTAPPSPRPGVAYLPAPEEVATAPVRTTAAPARATAPPPRATPAPASAPVAWAPAPPVPPVRAPAAWAAAPRPTPQATRLRTWLRGAGLVLVLALFGVRAGMASLAFMLPGGVIVGWSRPPVVAHPLKTPPATATQHPLTPAQYAALLTPQLSLDQELGQMMIVQFVGTDVGPDLTQMISADGAGGVLYFAPNIGTAGQVQQLNAQLQQMAGVPLLVAVDQEGGEVNRLQALYGDLPGASSLATPADALARGQQDATLLHGLGFNLNLAPVVDVGYDNPQLYGRTFGDTPDRVASMAGAYIQGLQQSGQLTAVPKHFPGLGGTNTDPHLGMPVLSRSRADWEAIDVAPYRTLLAHQDVRAIMVTHEMIPAVDQNLPSTLSPTVVDGTLRQELGFQGVVVTDDLHMAALNQQWPFPQAAVLAIVAGSDIITAPDSPDEVQQVKDAITAAIASGQLTRARIDQSVRRILELKIRMGLIALPRPSGAHPPGGQTGVGAALPLGAAMAWVRPRAAGAS